MGETPTCYRARDHSALASVPGCIAKDLTRPSRDPSRNGEARRALAPYGSPAGGDAVATLVAKGALNGVHFHTDDLDATFEKVRAAGAEIVQEPTDEPWGTRDFAVRDPSGNLVRID